MREMNNQLRSRLHRTENTISLKLLGGLCVAGAIAVAYRLRGPELVAPLGSLPFALYAILPCLFLRFRSVALLWVALLSSYFVLLWISETKIALTSLPLTTTDLQIFLSRPSSSVEALKLSGWWFHALWLLPAGVALITGKTFYHARRIDWRNLTGTIAPATPALIATAVLSVCFLFFAGSYYRAVDVYARKSGYQLWEPDGVSALYKQIGLPGFLLYSLQLERRHGGDYFSVTAPEDAIPEAALKDAVSSYVQLAGKSGTKTLPNIVLVLVESTFDPNRVFNLNRTVTSTLFQHNSFTHSAGPLYVNAIGGGTWISEFEILVGLDSRLFGYSGYYTHASLSPYVRNSLVTYLKSKGYGTYAYYGVQKAFFSADKAFARYGFDHFLDKLDLKLTAPGWWSTDEEVIDAVLAHKVVESDRPFFRYINLLENHSPHTCRNFKPNQSFDVQFATTADFLENCQLNEYLRVLKSTERGVAKLMRYLSETESRTGRPFVLVLFGDHQPHTFTGTDRATHDFTRFRKNPDPRITFYHIMSSAERILNIPAEAMVHITVLPTLISAFAAKSEADIYLPASLYALKHCGADQMRTKPVGGYWIERGAEPGSRCAELKRVLRAYQMADIIGAN